MRIDGEGYLVETNPLDEIDDDWDTLLDLDETPVPSREGHPKPNILKEATDD